MKSLFAAMTFVALLTPATHAQLRPGTDREFWLLKGPVKTVRLERAEISVHDGKEVEEPRRLRSVTTYDERGYLSRVESYSYKGDLSSTSLHSRDGQGTRTVISDSKDGAGKKSVTASAPDGRVLDTFVYDENGVLLRKIVRKYDAAKKLTEIATLNPNGSILARTVFLYTAEGKQAADIYYNKEGRVYQKTEIVGDEVIGTSYYPDGNIWSRTVFKRSKAEVENDSHGNWIRKVTRQTVTRGGETREEAYVEYRTITYYPAPKAESKPRPAP